MLTTALIIGMTPDQFWHGEPSLFYNYLDAYDSRNEMENKLELERINLSAWLTGLYVMKARIASPALGKGKEYPSKPIKVNMQEKEEEKMKKMTDEEREEYEMKQAIAQFEAFGKYADAFNKQHFGGEASD